MVVVGCSMLRRAKQLYGRSFDMHQKWLVWQELMLFILNVCILWQKSKKNANADVKCKRSFSTYKAHATRWPTGPAVFIWGCSLSASQQLPRSLVLSENTSIKAPMPVVNRHGVLFSPYDTMVVRFRRNSFW